jgi:hypothetical protein
LPEIDSTPLVVLGENFKVPTRLASAALSNKMIRLAAVGHQLKTQKTAFQIRSSWTQFLMPERFLRVEDSIT